MNDVSSLLSRRNLLVGLAGTGIATGAVASPLFASPNTLKAALRPQTGRHNVPLGTATEADWVAQIGSLFTAQSGQVLQLTGVAPFGQKGTRPAWTRQTGFVARFEVVSGGAMPEGTMRFRHKEGGTFEMHVAPAGNGAPPRVIAIFN